MITMMIVMCNWTFKNKEAPRKWREREEMYVFNKDDKADQKT